MKLLLIVGLLTACEIQPEAEFHCERFLPYRSGHKKRPELQEIYRQCRSAELTYYSGANK